MNKLEHFPISFFAMVMGLTGLTLVWQKAGELFGLNPLIGNGLLSITFLTFFAVSLAYLIKLNRFTGAVKAEFNHPVKISFFPAFSISLILLGTATLHLAPNLSLALWLSGSLIHLLFTLYVLGQWLHHPKFAVPHSTPAWFIPVVGNILVPIAGVEHGYVEFSWFFFAIGLVYWIVLKTLIFNRMFFHDPLPEKLLPTLFILIAPPAVGFISYTKLNGELDNFGRILFYAALFLVLLLLSQAPKFLKIKFYMSWWAYSFPLAAASVASMLMYQMSNSEAMKIIAIMMIGLSSLVITFLFIRTLLAIGRNEICQPE